MPSVEPQPRHTVVSCSVCLSLLALANGRNSSAEVNKAIILEALIFQIFDLKGN